MTSLHSSRSILAVLGLVLAASCSPAPKPPAQTTCTKNTDCSGGDVCTNGACVTAPCGGMCTAEQICKGNACVSAYGLTCSATMANSCPALFTCVNDACAKGCMANSDCPNAPLNVCNINTFTCAECSVSADCNMGSSSGTKLCTSAGLCVGCLMDSDCYVDGEPADMYCDTATQSCMAGCTTLADCPAGTMYCQPLPAAAVKSCLQCEQSTDCVGDPQLPVCNQANGTCVQCNDNTDCTTTTGQCNAAAHQCVTCVENSVCPFGQICDTTSFMCIAGCSPTSPSNCAAGMVCDSSMGTNGTCVACLMDSDCPIADTCDMTTGTNMCVPGCTTDDHCNANPPVGPHQYCDVNLGEFGQCVGCISDANCTIAGMTTCDSMTHDCRCGKTGESCGADSDCGYELEPNADGGMSPDCNALGARCINQIECEPGGGGSPIMPSIHPICTVTGEGLANQCTPQQGNCPAGYVVELGAGSDNMGFTKVCVPSAENQCIGEYCGGG